MSAMYQRRSACGQSDNPHCVGLFLGSPSAILVWRCGRARVLKGIEKLILRGTQVLIDHFVENICLLLPSS